MRNLQLLIYMVLSSVCYGNYITVTAYYPSGIPYDVFGFGKVTDRLHIGNRWMSLGMNTYDNTARFHYPLIPSFDTPDPCLDKYPDLSPYSHCAGNPLRYVDPSGKLIYGTDDSPITYDETTNTLSENTPDDVREIGSAMLLTKPGRDRLVKMLNDNKADYIIEYGNTEEFIKGRDPKDLQVDAFGVVIYYISGTSEGDRVTGAKIIIDKERIKTKGNSDDHYKGENFPLDAMIGFAAVHESEHALNEKARSISKDVTVEQAERVAMEAELDAKNDYLRSYEREVTKLK